VVYDGRAKVTHAVTTGFSWSKPFLRDPKPDKRSGHSLAAVGKFIYLFGGYSKVKECALGDLYIFCTSNTYFLLNLELTSITETLKWRKPEPAGVPPSARHSHSCTAVGKDIFIVGGLTRTGRSNDVHVLNTGQLLSESCYCTHNLILCTETMTWSQPETKGTPPTPRDSHSATLLHGSKLMIVGGRDEKRKHRCGGVYILDLKTFEWTACSVDATSLKLVEKSASIVKSKFFIYH